MRAWLVVPLAVSAGCFSPEEIEIADTDTQTLPTGDTGTSTLGMTSASSTDAPTTVATDPTSSTATTNDPGTDTEIEPSTGGSDSATSTGETELGPQIVLSTPADADLNAPLDTYFFLYFDRVVSTADATGRIHVSQDGAPAVPVSPIQCPPDNDPTCIAAVLPASFADGDSGRLPGGTPHQIIVDPDFADPDGNLNTIAQTVDYTTFAFEANVIDDSNAINSELGGIVYDSVGENLYLFGSTSANTCIVRRVPAPGGVLGPASTAATLPPAQAVCYGMSLYDDAIYATQTYGNQVVRYNNLALADLADNSTVLGPATGLPDPDDDLGEVWSVAAQGGRTFFAFGNFHGGVNSHSILELNAAGAYGVYNDGTNLWSSNGDDEVVLASGVVAGTPFLFAHDGDEIHKIRLSDGAILTSHELDGSSNSPDMTVDDSGRLYVGTSGGITVYDGTDFTQLAQRLGVTASRFGVAATDDQATIYYGRYRDPAVIGRLQIDF